MNDSEKVEKFELKFTRYLLMTDNNNQIKIKQYINEIIEACKNDPIRQQVAISNFQALCDSMKGYERAPRYYNAIFEEGSQQANSVTIRTKRSDAEAKHPIETEFEKIYNRKLKLTELQQLEKEISSKLQLKIDRNTKRSKICLLQWFSSNWEKIKPKIIEFGLDKMDFGAQNKK